jgi:uncharacterized membrane protein YbaN (DUF454 family)
MKKLSKGIFLVTGMIFLGIGFVGVVIPLLPTTPFLLLSTFFFLKSSDKVYNWFINTKVYKEKVKPLKEDKAMIRKSKIKIIFTVTILLSFSLYLAREMKISMIIIACIWLLHILYFTIVLKTVSEE